jgi:hypothetical protein
VAAVYASPIPNARAPIPKSKKAAPDTPAVPDAYTVNLKQSMHKIITALYVNLMTFISIISQ